MRGGFHHYATLLDDGRENRARSTSTLAMPVLALNGEFGIPQHQTVDGVRRVAKEPEVDMVPGAGHALAEDNPAWLARRLREFFG
jgi:pimeloyl-ACP methyl ester carboxylesterase